MTEIVVRFMQAKRGELKRMRGGISISSSELIR
jgi:hypothetical protein